jgi:hypothetical protein
LSKDENKKLKNPLKENKNLESKMLKIFNFISHDDNFLGSFLKDYTCVLYLLIYGEGMIILFFFLCVYILLLNVIIYLFFIIDKNINTEIVIHLWELLKRNSDNKNIQFPADRMHELVCPLIINNPRPFFWNENNIKYLMV